MVPDDPDVWHQRAGRAERNFSINAFAILLVQPSVFQEVKTKDGSDEVTFKKTIHPALREWIE
ncbi:hypothetical protein K438DRAFT_2138304, partial [Mycena galopus ATCC 62051]